MKFGPLFTASLFCCIVSFTTQAGDPPPTTRAVRFYLPGDQSTGGNHSHDASGADASAVPSIPVSPPATVSLNGDWDFSYDGITEAKKRGVTYAQQEVVPDLPLSQSYEASMPVPAYWDDHLSNLQNTSWWFWAQFNSTYRKVNFPMGNLYYPAFANLPYLVGTGYYRRILDVPEDWNSKRVALRIGGVVAGAKVYLNGAQVGEKTDYLTPGEVDLSRKIRPGPNELIIAVTNRDSWARGNPTSCAIDGYQGFTGGIYGDVALHICSSPRIQDLYVRGAGEKLHWQADIDGVAANASLQWSIHERGSEAAIASGELPLTKDGLIEWDTNSAPMLHWTERNPKLYELQVKSVVGGKLQDQCRQKFGLRTLSVRDGNILLNDKVVYLRGFGESWYYPKTTGAPFGRAANLEMIRKYQALGFNWTRSHTSIPRQDYLDAADELGMLVQVEGPRDADDQTWISMLKAARNHPSVILYCVSNEQLLDEEAIAMVIRRHDQTKKLAPDALFTPMEALRGVEYGAGRKDFGPDAVDKPFLHNPRRLAMLKPVADTFETTGWNHFSFESATKAKASEINANLSLFERPVTLHELGIDGTYLDLSLTDRYRGTRIGMDLFDSVRQYLSENGLLEKANLYYRNSCRWAPLLRKHAVERTRLCEVVKGYDMLGAIDLHWLFYGYTCGVMNEFFELKPGESTQDVLNYNGESILVTDLDVDRVFAAGTVFKTQLFASLFGEQPLSKGSVYWNARDDSGKIWFSGTIPVENLSVGKLSPLTEIQFKCPAVSEGVRLRISAKLLGAEYDLANQWDIWVFPESKPVQANASPTQLHIVPALTHEEIQYLTTGGRVLLLGGAPFKTAPTSFQIWDAGGVIGNAATIISEHPIFAGFPHEGFCDWQFYEMLNGGSAIAFDDVRIPFEPILEIASNYKLLKKQAAVFELRVGKGSLLVCSLNLKTDDPAGQFLRSNLIRYAAGGDFHPTVSVQPELLDALLK